jgi:ABC-2 type transport system permease protein
VAQVVIEIPQGLEGDLKRGRSTEVQVLINGTDPIRAQVAMNTTLQYFQQQSQELALSRLRQSAAQQNQQATWPMLKMEPRILYNPQLKSSVYMVPGVAALTLLVVTTIVTAMGIAREREMGTIEQILITPLRPIVLLLGKIFPFALIGLVVAGLVLSVGTQLFSVPIRGSLLAIFLGTLLYLMSTLGTGVFISTIARTQQQAIMGGFFFLLPAILLSGFMSPVENMPAWIQPLTWINPVRYYVQILRASLLKGAKVTDLWLPLSALLGFGVGILSLAALRFRKQLA